MTTNKAR